MKSNAGERLNLEPFYISAVKSRLTWCELRFNEHPLTSDDFETICDAENIILIRDSRKWNGAYFKRKGRDIIYIKSSLSGALKVFVEFHELAHYWLHEPGFYLSGCNRLWINRSEYQASLIAACALIPKIYIERFSKSELQDLYLHPDIVDFRLRVYRSHNV